MKLHPRVLGADRGNFTAAVGGCEHANRAQLPPPQPSPTPKWNADGDAAQAGSVLAWMSLNLPVTDGGRKHKKFPVLIRHL